MEPEEAKSTLRKELNTRDITFPTSKIITKLQ